MVEAVAELEAIAEDAVQRGVAVKDQAGQERLKKLLTGYVNYLR